MQHQLFRSFPTFRTVAPVVVAVWLAAGCAPASSRSHDVSTGVSHHRATPSSAAAPSLALHHTVVLNDGERLTPPPSTARPSLSASQAWRRYATRNHAKINRTHLPRGATAYLAVFTTSGDIRHRVVYGYRIPGCHPVYTLQPPTPYPTNCVGWQILDANTSSDLDLAWQGLPGGTR